MTVSASRAFAARKTCSTAHPAPIARPACPPVSTSSTGVQGNSKSQKRAQRRNNVLSRKATSPWATEEQYELFRAYLDSRHANGGMADMDVFEFAAMIEETPIRSRVVEYTDRVTGALVGVSLTDVLGDGLSMVYSFYDPVHVKSSIGTYMILDHIDIAREAGLPYVYLGYWLPGTQ